MNTSYHLDYNLHLLIPNFSSELSANAECLILSLKHSGNVSLDRELSPDQCGFEQVLRWTRRDSTANRVDFVLIVVLSADFENYRLPLVH